MKLEKPGLVMIVVAVVVIAAAGLSTLINPSWLAAILAGIVGVILGSFLRHKGLIK
jgi:hypothetical protein